MSTVAEEDQLCPTCGQRLPPKELFVGGYRRRQLVEILTNYPRGLTRSELLDQLYADIDESRDPRIISVFVHRANKELAPQGWTIRSALEPPHRYVLERL